MHFFTSITANYIPKARVLAKSVKEHNPQAIFHLMLSDGLPERVDPDKEPFDSIIYPEDLEIPNLESWVFKHALVELCTAVKGPAFAYIFETKGAEKVVYLDPDIMVLHDLSELSRILDSASVVLTPHQVVPDEDVEAIVDNEICSLKHGVYNIGFLAIRNDEQGRAFLSWWRDRLASYCYDDIPNGLFTDQRWVDLAPCFFDNIRILRDKTYNVATWNLTHRHVERALDGRLIVEGAPVKFFHFSGFDSGDQEVMLGKYAPKNSPLFELRKRYIGRLYVAGQRELGDLPCKYDNFSNGDPITKEHRLVYRNRADLQDAFPNPAVTTGNSNCFYNWFNHTWPLERDRHPEIVCKFGTPIESGAAIADLQRELAVLRNSFTFRLGRSLMTPWRILKTLLGRELAMKEDDSFLSSRLPDMQPPSLTTEE